MSSSSIILAALLLSSPTLFGQGGDQKPAPFKRPPKELLTIVSSPLFAENIPKHWDMLDEEADALSYRYWLIIGTEKEITTRLNQLWKKYRDDRISVTNPK